MLLLSTSSLVGYGLHRIFEFAKKSEYDGIDLCIDFSAFDTFNAEYLRKLSADFGVKIVSVTMPEKQLTTNQLEFVLQMAADLGVKMVNSAAAPFWARKRLVRWAFESSATKISEFDAQCHQCTAKNLDVYHCGVRRCASRNYQKNDRTHRAFYRKYWSK